VDDAPTIVPTPGILRNFFVFRVLILHFSCKRCPGVFLAGTTGWPTLVYDGEYGDTEKEGMLPLGHVSVCELLGSRGRLVDDDEASS
jgi:hypothetical protein